MWVKVKMEGYPQYFVVIDFLVHESQNLKKQKI